MGDLPLDLVNKSEELNKYYEPLGFRIKPLYWKQPLFVDAEKGKSPQEIIMEKIGNYDLYFGIMGSKYGEELEGYSVSPTEFEFNDALERKASSGCKYPRIVCFSFLKVLNKASYDSNQLDRVQIFRNNIARKQAISNEYDSIVDIKSLFEAKLSECVETSNVKYQYPEDYKIQLYITDRNKPQDPLFGSAQKNLIDEIKEGKKVLLTGSGGSGKSTYLKYIAYLFSYKLDAFTPVLIKLKLYKANSIDEAIIEESKSLPKKPILLIDGYDELSDNSKPEFHKQLLIWMDRNPEAPIVITSRPTDPSKTPMRGYQSFDMAVLRYEQFSQYIMANDVEESLFTNSPIWNELYPLMQIPFYLVKIVDFYKQKGIVPQSISEILEFSIYQGIEDDKEHFEATFIADYEYDELGYALMKLAFCMTNSGKTSATRKELSELFEDNKLESLLRRYCRLIESFRNVEDTYYSFSHKIFQDYLAAKSICSIKELDILKIITNFSEERISFNWEPSIQYILEFLPEDARESISQHIKQYQPELLIEVLPDLLTEEIRKDLFTTIFELYANTTQYIPRSVNIRKLATIWDSPDKEKYLIDFISDFRNHNYMIIIAFILLSYSKQYNKELIDTTLIGCLQIDSLIGYRKSLNNIATMYINIDRFDQELLRKLYNKDKTLTIQLLVKYDETYQYISELIDLYIEIEQRREINQQNSETKSYIENYLVKCFKANHFHELIKTLVSKQLLKNTHCLDDEIDDLVEFALEHYSLDAIYEDMYLLYLHSMETMSDKHFDSLSKYFIRCGIELEVIKRIISENKEVFGLYLYKLITLNQDSKEFIEGICNEVLPKMDQQRREFIFKLLANNNINTQYSVQLQAQGINLSEYKEFSISEKIKLRYRLDTEIVLKLDRLIEELENLFGESDELSKSQFGKVDRFSICSLVYNFLSDGFNTMTKVNKQQSIERFTREHVNLVLKFIEDNYIESGTKNLFNNEENNFEIPLDLKEWLKEWKSEVLSSCSIPDAIQQIYQIGSLINLDVSRLWKFIKAGLVQVENSILLDYLSFVDDTDQEWDFITTKINNPAIVKSKVLHNLEKKSNLTWMPLANHIWFCVRNHYSEVLPHSYDILRRIESDFGSDGDEHLIYCCLESIIRLETNQTRFWEYVKDCPIKELTYLAKGFVKEKKRMDGLISRLKMEINSKNTESKPLYLYYLCCMGDEGSFNAYSEVIKQQKTFFIEYDFPNPFENIRKESLLGSLIDLLVFGLKNEINQSHYQNLTRCICSGIENISYSSKENYDKVINLLNELALKYPKHNDNYILYETIWRIKDEFLKRTTLLPTLTESAKLYYKFVNK